MSLSPKPHLWIQRIMRSVFRKLCHRSISQKFSPGAEARWWIQYGSCSASGWTSHWVSFLLLSQPLYPTPLSTWMNWTLWRLLAKSYLKKLSWLDWASLWIPSLITMYFPSTHTITLAFPYSIYFWAGEWDKSSIVCNLTHYMSLFSSLLFVEQAQLSGSRWVCDHFACGVFRSGHELRQNGATGTGSALQVSEYTIIATGHLSPHMQIPIHLIRRFESPRCH